MPYMELFVPKPDQHAPWFSISEKDCFESPNIIDTVYSFYVKIDTQVKNLRLATLNLFV